MSFISDWIKKMLEQFAENLNDNSVKFGISDGIEIADLIIKPESLNSKLEESDIDLRFEYAKLGNIKALWTALPGIITLQIKDLDIRIRPNLTGFAVKKFVEKVKEISFGAENLFANDSDESAFSPGLCCPSWIDHPTSHYTKTVKASHNSIPQPPPMIKRGVYVNPRNDDSGMLSCNIEPAFCYPFRDKNFTAVDPTRQHFHREWNPMNLSKLPCYSKTQLNYRNFDLTPHSSNLKRDYISYMNINALPDQNHNAHYVNYHFKDPRFVLNQRIPNQLNHNDNGLINFEALSPLYMSNSLYENRREIYTTGDKYDIGQSYAAPNIQKITPDYCAPAFSGFHGTN